MAAKDLLPLTIDVLQKAVAGGVAAIRSRTRLEPAGGPGDKIFPPTYMKEGRAETKYALEMRRIEGQEVKTVLLDSVASQANRMEEALLEGHRRDELAFPLVAVDFSGEEGLKDLEQITTLQAPHRIADALLRDSLLDGTPFRETVPGRAFSDARVTNATAMYRYCPTALIFGVWDSTGPKGGLGAKFQRALVSEIVGIGAVVGVKTASRIDPAAIQKNTPVYQSKTDSTDWVIEEKDAAQKTKKPIPFSRKGAEGKGTPAAINHGNIPPSIDHEAGGVTVDHALQTVVLSMPALRRLRFQEDVTGNRLEAKARFAAEDAARTALAALALAAIVYQREAGFDLRSRSLLVPTAPLTLEVVPADGSEPKRYSLERDGAKALLAKAGVAAAKAGFGWDADPLTLKPAQKLAALIRKSRELCAEGEGEDAEAAVGN